MNCEEQKYTPLDREHPMVPGGDLDEHVREALKETFAEMKDPVELLLFVSDRCYYCTETEKLLKQFEELSPAANGRKKLTLKVLELPQHAELAKRYGVMRTPATVLLEGAIKWIGIPSGEEIRSLVETIMRISEGESGLESETKRIVRSLSRKVSLEVIVTPACPYCPYVVVLANMLAYESYVAGNKNITACTIEAFENPDIADRYGIFSVPAIVINSRDIIVGLPYERDLIERIVKE